MFDMLYGSYLYVVIMIHVMLIFINNIIYVIYHVWCCYRVIYHVML